MSNMIPRETIDALRQQLDVTMDNFGMDCDLYIPTTGSLDAAETLDVYIKPSDLTFVKYTAKVFMEWSANSHRLRKLGIYVENESPLLSWFGRKATNADGDVVDVDIVPQSYFSIDMEFVPGNTLDTNQFEVVDFIPGKTMQDAVIKKGFIVAPRRVDT